MVKQDEGGVEPPNKTPPVVIGRSESDYKKFGTNGSILLGKIYSQLGEELKLDNDIYMDVSGAHVVFICGKRGGGKSYTMGVVAEGFTLMPDEIRSKLSIIMLDTMGIYWTMTHANKEEKDLLKPFGLRPHGIKVKIYTPFKYFNIYKKKGIPTDAPFMITTSELTEDDFCAAFKIDKYGEHGILLAKVLAKLRLIKPNYTILDIIEELKSSDDDKRVKTAVVSMMEMADGWGIFADKGTPLHELATGGQLTVLDVGCYATMPSGTDVKALVVGIVSRHLFVQRMEYRKGEEVKHMKVLENYYGNKEIDQDNMPLVWLVIDEAHEFLPKDPKDANPATEPLVTIMREGRQPGISLILATQQPGKIHTDVMTQSDTVLSHRITARMDVEALGLLAQSWMAGGISRAMDSLPELKGTAVVFDDANEKLYQIRVRPRFTWHGGSSPSAMKKE